jgi:L-asparagine transporter-like permease
VVLALPIATFAFGGIELIGVTAGEARDPARTLPRAINGVVWRILIFYIGAMAVIMALVAWD